MMLNLLLHFFHYMKSFQIWSYFCPYFPVFGLNTEDWIYSINLRTQSEYRKIRTRNNSVFGHFSRSFLLSCCWNCWKKSLTEFCKSISQEDDLITLSCVTIQVITFKIFLIEKLFLRACLLTWIPSVCSTRYTSLYHFNICNPATLSLSLSLKTFILCCLYKKELVIIQKPTIHTYWKS